MTTMVLTVIGDDRSGLVDALSAVIATHGGSWDRSHMARLAGKFAGIVQVTAPDDQAQALIADLEPLKFDGLLDVVVAVAAPDRHGDISTRISLELVGQDRPGIVHEVSRTLAELGVSIEELRTGTVSTPMAGGMLFEANAQLRIPPELAVAELERRLENLAPELMVDIRLVAEAN